MARADSRAVHGRGRGLALSERASVGLCAVGADTGQTGTGAAVRRRAAEGVRGVRRGGLFLEATAERQAVRVPGAHRPPRHGVSEGEVE